jgi:hypothetical protein
LLDLLSCRCSSLLHALYCTHVCGCSILTLPAPLVADASYLPTHGAPFKRSSGAPHLLRWQPPFCGRWDGSSLSLCGSCCVYSSAGRNQKGCTLISPSQCLPAQVPRSDLLTALSEADLVLNSSTSEGKEIC